MATITAPALDPAELRRLLRATDPAALLVPPRVLRRVIKLDRRLGGLGLRVPHAKSYVIGRDVLLTLAERAELGIEAENDLPDTLLLIAAPDPIRLAQLPRDWALVKCWRLLFHARVHAAVAARRLTADEVQARLAAIGRAEFDEIRTVLRHEKYLVPPRDDATAYEEFAALFLELRHFRPAMLAHFFPGLDDPERIDRVLRQDVDAAALLLAARLPGAPEPATLEASRNEAAVPAEVDGTFSMISPAAATALLMRAERALAKGNSVRAALLRQSASHTEAADVAAAGSIGARDAIARLVDRLASALGWDHTARGAWTAALTALLPGGARGFWTSEARLLYDLQKICLDHERPIYSVDLVEWAYALFRRPLVQPLPSQPRVRALKHLRRALALVPALTVAGRERAELSRLLHDALHSAAEHVRDQLRPTLMEAIRRAGLAAHNFPERVSLAKLVEELLDRVVERGFINLGDVRDAVARNEVKLADLSGPRELVCGDPLLRINRDLARAAAGTYRRGEIYLRGLQRFNALFFGTRLGRWLTLFVLIPFVGAFATLVFLHEIAQLVRLAPYMPWVRAEHHAQPSAHEPQEALGKGEEAATAAAGHVAIDWGRLGMASLVLGTLFWLLMHSPLCRRWLVAVGRLGWVGLRRVCYDWPLALTRWPPLIGFFSSPPVVFVGRYVVRPLPIGLLVGLTAWLAGIEPMAASALAGAALAAVGWFVNSRWGRAWEEAATDWVLGHWEYLSSLVPGLVRLLIDWSHAVLEGVDRLIYEVDETFRFRGGENRLTLAAKIVFGYLWFLVSYVARLFINVLIEPTVNPIKHFPAVTVAAKLLMPFWVPLTELLAAPIMFLGPPLAYSLAFFVLHLLPGAAGFLVWEFKENWRLYRANRRTHLGPVVVGCHGETMVRLLRPGFHAGTLPKLFTKLRRAERWVQRGGPPYKVHRLREMLHHVEESLARFAERELLAFVNRSRSWTSGPLRLAASRVGSNRVRFWLVGVDRPTNPIELRFEELSGVLHGSIVDDGWLATLEAKDAAA
ncbi:MAG: hypothetical protein NZO58_00580, partial [Gemmataceae bacterium]|nr:hypothetical protein [Gemmataceae bacterium]